MKRKATGRFAKGNPGGPGRPSTPPPPPPAAGPTDAAELIIAASFQRDVDDAWRHIVASFRPDVVRELAIAAEQNGKRLPTWVRDFCELPPPKEKISDAPNHRRPRTSRRLGHRSSPSRSKPAATPRAKKRRGKN